MGNIEGMMDEQEMRRMDNSLSQSLPPSYDNAGRDIPDWYIDFEADLEKFKHYIKAEVFDPSNKNNPWKKIGRPIMNDYGANMFIAFVQMTAASKNLIMSGIPDIKIGNSICRDICINCNTYLIGHMREYEVELKDVPLLNTIVRNVVRASTLRALFGEERNRVGKTFSRQDIINPQQKRRGLLDTIFQVPDDSGV